MIVRAARELEIGEVLIMDYEGNEANGHLVKASNHPFKIIRKATFEEYYADCIETLGPPPSGYVVPTTGYFFEVHTD